MCGYGSVKRVDWMVVLFAGGEKLHVKNTLPRRERLRRLLTCSWATVSTFGKGVPIVTINTHSVLAARAGAALPGVVTPGAILSGAGVHSALPQPFSPVVANWRAGFVTPRVLPATTMPLGVLAAGLPINIRKQYVHKTRVNVGGDGASGPHPEREPA